ncbi:G-protein coupled receptor 35-like [Anolis sagrei]|uniref:G-protein coupled receptor 35-like n=1 Tax=Anolis sagrei TaxID=38937 RepID=UPI0035226E39
MNQDKMHETICNITESQLIYIIETCVYIPAFICGFFLNVWALGMFCCKLNKWNETRVYMTNLAAADCLFVLTLPVSLVFKTKSVNTVCHVLESAYFVNRYMSVFLITITAIDRYIAIAYPLKAKSIRSPRKSAIVCGFLWILLISIICTVKFADERSEQEICFIKVTKKPSVFLLASVIWGFLIPLAILSFCSIRITTKLIKKKHTHPQEVKLIQKAINIIFANMIVFIICFLPLHVALFIRFIADFRKASCAVMENIELYVRLAAILANTNCCLDAICYYFVNKEFQEASLKLSTKYLSHLNQGSEKQGSENM